MDEDNVSVVGVAIYDTEELIPGVTIHDGDEVIENCTIQIWRNSVTGDESVGWYRNGRMGEA